MNSQEEKAINKSVEGIFQQKEEEKGIRLSATRQVNFTMSNNKGIVQEETQS